MLSVSHACAWPVKPCSSRSGVRPSPPQSRRWRRTPFATRSRSRGRRRFIRSGGLLLGGEPELLLEDEPHFGGGRAPQRATGRVVLALDHLAVLVHGRILLGLVVLGRQVHRLGADGRHLGGG